MGSVEDLRGPNRQPEIGGQRLRTAYPSGASVLRKGSPTTAQEHARYLLSKRFEKAAFAARRLWPGPVGEHMFREIDSARKFPFLVQSAYWRAVVEDVLAREEAQR